MFSVGRRDFLGMASVAAIVPALPAFAQATSLGPRAVPISKAERAARVVKAQRLMRDAGISALLVEPGGSLIYFTGVHWNRSERLTAAVIPAEGQIGVFTPFFEEPSVRETLAVDADVRTWNEDDDPLKLVGDWLRERKHATGKIGMEETVRHFALDGLQRALPDATMVSGASVVRGCRMIKSPAEIALMQLASDITIAAYRDTFKRIERGMTPSDIGKMMGAATAAHGGNHEFALILLGEASAYPHGSGKQQEVREGEVVLMDCGCSVEGYQSDISRSFVFGEANAKQRQVWDQMRKGEDIAFAAARPGAPAGTVDDAVRAYYTKLGYGPNYRLPGLSHRTGHGIGLDGHEPVNLVRGEKTPLAPGMCFSNEPGIYIPGSFGIRLEDCFHMTAEGPRWFSTPPPSIDRPFD